MRIFDLEDKQGKLVAFEVRNILLSRRAACKIAKTVPGSKLLERPKLFRSKSDFCKFQVGSRTFIIEEPWNDNSRYWIGPEPTEPCSEILPVREAFERH